MRHQIRLEPTTERALQLDDGPVHRTYNVARMLLELYAPVMPGPDRPPLDQDTADFLADLVHFVDTKSAVSAEEVADLACVCLDEGAAQIHASVRAALLPYAPASLAIAATDSDPAEAQFRRLLTELAGRLQAGSL